MRKDLEEGYIPSCRECLQNKSTTTRQAGPLHLLPVPEECCSSVSMDFIGPLLEDDGYDMILTINDQLNSEICIIATKSNLTAEELALIFFNNWYCENGLPESLIVDQDKLFMSKFWKHMMILTGVKMKCLSSFHPQTNGASKRSNKTVNQMLCFHVEQNQSGWSRALPLIHFQIMSTVNKSTGYTPFQLCFSRSPMVLPLVINGSNMESTEAVSAKEIIERVALDVANARDNLLLAKISQAHQANKKQVDGVDYAVGDKVMLSTLNRCREYKADRESPRQRVAKFMPRFDGLYLVTDVNNEASTITLDMPNAPNVFPTFHSSLVKPFCENNNKKYPGRTLDEPGPIMVDGMEEFLVEKIIDHKRTGRGYRYLVQF